MRHRSGRVSHARLAMLPAILLMPLGACASGGVGSPAEPRAAEVAPSRSDAPTRIVVDNRSWDQVTVFIVVGSAQLRLGDVEPMTRRSLALKGAQSVLGHGSAYFVGRRLAGSVFRSESFDVNPEGGTPSWTIDSHAPFSYVLIR